MIKKTAVVILLVSVFIFTSTGIAAACTIFTVSEDDTVIFGNNEDFTNPNTYYWVHPGGEDYYGGVYFGFDNFWPQGGINEKGLAFDINSLPETPLNDHPELPYFDTYEGYSILANCTTVKEAIDHVRKFNWGSAMWGQIHVADATGDAVVIGPGSDGELAFTRKSSGDGYLISTNFNPALQTSQEAECDRFQKADKFLQKVGDTEELTLKYVKTVLSAAHTEGITVNTQYSTVYDLKRGIINIYLFHQFDEVVELRVSEELRNPKEPILLSTLFSDATRKKVEHAKSRYSFLNTLKIVMVILGIAVVVVLVLFIFRFWRKRRRII